MKLKLQPLTEEAFAPFGQVLSWKEGEHPRRNFHAALFSDRGVARPNLRVQRTQPTALPFQTAQIERHAHSSQMFAPLSGGPFFVAVFLSDATGAPLLESGLAFRACGDQAVNYNAGTWHLGFMAADRPGTFLMLRWEDGTPGDEEVLMLDTTVTIEAY
jgi:ureidoglycolate lyase